MKKHFKIYALIWAILIALFNVIVFVTPNEAGGMSKFGGAFWVGYIFITIAFIGQFVCSYVAFKAVNLKKLFYRIPLISISYSGLIVMMIFGTACMAIPDLPNWIGIITCMLILGFNAIAVLKAQAAARIVSDTDEKIQAQTSFIRNLTMEAQSLINSEKADELRAEAKKVYEAIRYSDPISNNALLEIESEISNEFKMFSVAIHNDDLECVKISSNTLSELILKRNNQCKVIK